MGETLKVLGQANPSATTLTDLYTAPGATEVVASTLVICNRTSGKVEVRVAVAVAGASDSPEQYLAYDLPIIANDTVTLTMGMTLGAADVVRVYTDTAGVAFNLFGTEVS